MGYVGNTASLHEQKPMSPGHADDTAFLLGQKTHITTLRALGSLAFDFAYDIK